MGYLNYKYGVGQEDGVDPQTGANATTTSPSQFGKSIQYGTQLASYGGAQVDQKLFEPGGAFGGSKKQVGYSGVGSQYLSTYGQKETAIGTRAVDRYFGLSGRKGEYVQNFLSQAGIIDQSRLQNAAFQAKAEGALFAAGKAQQQALNEAQSYIDDQAAYGYQQAADLESRLLGETRTNLAGSGLWNSSMQGQAATYALERGMRARLAVNSEAAGLYQRIALGKGAAAAETYTRLAGFYEGARQTNEQSLLFEFDWRAGRSDPDQRQQGGDNSAGWQAAGTAVGAIAAAIW